MPALELLSVSKRFRRRAGFLRAGAEVCALDAVSLAVDEGEVCVLVGPNGSGKTTLLKLVSTVLLPDSGRILVGGVDTQLEPAAVRRQVGFAIASERSFYPRLTVRENLDFFAALEDVPRRDRAQRVRWALEQTETADAQDTPAYQLSSGTCQRVGVARALLKRPSLLLLDEPSRSVDARGAAQFRELVRDLADAGAAVLVTTHNFEEAIAIGDSVGVLHRGRLTARQALSTSTGIEGLRSLYFRETNEAAVEVQEAR